MRMTGSFAQIMKRCIFRVTKLEGKTSSGCRYVDRCDLFKSNKICKEENCLLFGGEKNGNQDASSDSKEIRKDK